MDITPEDIEQLNIERAQDEADDARREAKIEAVIAYEEIYKGIPEDKRPSFEEWVEMNQD